MGERKPPLGEVRVDKALFFQYSTDEGSMRPEKNKCSVGMIT